MEQARSGSQKIDELLKQKLLSLNYDKSKYILLGNRKAKNRMRNELMKHPMKMGEETLDEEDDEEPRFWKKARTNRGEDRKKNIKTISVMFIPYTVNGGLAKQTREAEEELGRQTGYKIKIIERTGTRIMDLLHKSNPWQGEDCRRPGCLLCSTKVAARTWSRTAPRDALSTKLGA